MLKVSAFGLNTSFEPFSPSELGALRRLRQLCSAACRTMCQSGAVSVHWCHVSWFSVMVFFKNKTSRCRSILTQDFAIKIIKIDQILVVMADIKVLTLFETQCISNFAILSSGCCTGPLELASLIMMNRLSIKIHEQINPKRNPQKFVSLANMVCQKRITWITGLAYIHYFQHGFHNIESNKPKQN
jgi:hypothetical protein